MQERLNKKWKGISVKWWIVGVGVVGVIGSIVSGSGESSPEQAGTEIAGTPVITIGVDTKPVITGSLSGDRSGPGTDQHSAGSATETTAPAESIMEADLKVLLDLSESNIVAADAEYKGKLIKTTGKISDITKSSIVLKPVNGEMFSVADAECELLEEEKSKIIALRSEQEVTVSGRMTGFFTSFGIRANIEDCRILN